MIAEAIDALFTLGWALLVWILLLSAVGTLAVWTVGYGMWRVGRATVRGVKASRAALSCRLPASSPAEALRELHDAPEAPQTPSRPSPSWARDKDAA